MIQFEQVSKNYDGHAALSDVSFFVTPGEMVFLTGHSGAGKSTILKLMLRIEAVSQGVIHIQRQNIQRLSKRQIPFLRRQIGMIFQNPQLLSERTVFDNVALPLVIAGCSQREINRRVYAALEKVGLSSKEKLLPEFLSCGEQQRVNIARAVVNKPTILLADEPTGNLDPQLSIGILRLFEAFNAVGVTVLIATHDLPLIAKMPHRVITLKQGRITQRNLVSEPEHVGQA